MADFGHPNFKIDRKSDNDFKNEYPRLLQEEMQSIARLEPELSIGDIRRKAEDSLFCQKESYSLLMKISRRASISRSRKHKHKQASKHSKTSSDPSANPSSNPSYKPSSNPSSNPSANPSPNPSSKPSSKPSFKCFRPISLLSPKQSRLSLLRQCVDPHHKKKLKNIDKTLRPLGTNVENLTVPTSPYEAMEIKEVDNIHWPLRSEPSTSERSTSEPFMSEHSTSGIGYYSGKMAEFVHPNFKIDRETDIYYKKMYPRQLEEEIQRIAREDPGLNIEDIRRKAGGAVFWRKESLSLYRKKSSKLASTSRGDKNKDKTGDASKLSSTPSPKPSLNPSSQPSSNPIANPSPKPSLNPSYQPRSNPIANPSPKPSLNSSSQPRSNPIAHASSKPFFRRIKPISTLTPKQSRLALLRQCVDPHQKKKSTKIVKTLRPRKRKVKNLTVSASPNKAMEIEEVGDIKRASTSESSTPKSSRSEPSTSEPSTTSSKPSSKLSSEHFHFKVPDPPRKKKSKKIDKTLQPLKRTVNNSTVSVSPEEAMEIEEVGGDDIKRASTSETLTPKSSTSEPSMLELSTSETSKSEPSTPEPPRSEPSTSEPSTSEPSTTSSKPSSKLSSKHFKLPDPPHKKESKKINKTLQPLKRTVDNSTVSVSPEEAMEIEEVGGDDIKRASTSETSTPKPSTSEPSMLKLSTSETSTSEPSTPEPSTSEPSPPEPSPPEPSTSEPSTSELSPPELSPPEPSPPEPSTPEPSTSSKPSSKLSSKHFKLPDPSHKKKSKKIDKTLQPPKRTVDNSTVSVSPEEAMEIEEVGGDDIKRTSTSETSTPKPSTSELSTPEPSMSELSMSEPSTSSKPSSRLSSKHFKLPDPPHKKKFKKIDKTLQPLKRTVDNSTVSVSPDEAMEIEEVGGDDIKRVSTSETSPKPSTSEPSLLELSTQEPSTSEPSLLELSTQEPSTSETSTPEPSMSELSTPEPSTSEPSTPEPSMSELSMSDPSTSEPSTSSKPSSMLSSKHFHFKVPDPPRKKKSKKINKTLQPLKRTVDNSTVSVSPEEAMEIEEVGGDDINRASTSETSTSEPIMSESSQSQHSTLEPSMSEALTSEPSTSEASMSKPLTSEASTSTDFEFIRYVPMTVVTVDEENGVGMLHLRADNGSEGGSASQGGSEASFGLRRGKCKWFNVAKGWGFITPDDGGQDVFVHQSVIQMSGFRSLGDDEEVEFECQISDKGLEATKVSGPQSSDCRGSHRRPASKKRFRKIRCYNCGEFANHIAAKCSMGPQPKRCHNCKSEDHLIADCPTRVERPLKSSISGGSGGGDDPHQDNNGDTAAAASTSESSGTTPKKAE